jgi:hypothetical protein
MKTFKLKPSGWLPRLFIFLTGKEDSLPSNTCMIWWESLRVIALLPFLLVYFKDENGKCFEAQRSINFIDNSPHYVLTTKSLLKRL